MQWVLCVVRGTGFHNSFSADVLYYQSFSKAMVLRFLTDGEQVCCELVARAGVEGREREGKRREARLLLRCADRDGRLLWLASYCDCQPFPKSVNTTYIEQLI